MKSGAAFIGTHAVSGAALTEIPLEAVAQAIA
jgi:hypothetical protein